MMENHQVEFFKDYEYAKDCFYTGYGYKDKDDKFKGHGNASVKFNDGSTYFGQLVHNNQEGYGIFKWATGDIYKGQFFNG